MSIPITNNFFGLVETNILFSGFIFIAVSLISICILSILYGLAFRHLVFKVNYKDLLKLALLLGLLSVVSIQLFAIGPGTLSPFVITNYPDSLIWGNTGETISQILRPPNSIPPYAFVLYAPVTNFNEIADGIASFAEFLLVALFVKYKLRLSGRWYYYFVIGLSIVAWMFSVDQSYRFYLRVGLAIIAAIFIDNFVLNKKRTKIIALIIILFMLMGGGLYAWYSNNQKQLYESAIPQYSLSTNEVVNLFIAKRVSPENKNNLGGKVFCEHQVLGVFASGQSITEYLKTRCDYFYVSPTNNKIMSDTEYLKPGAITLQNQRNSYVVTRYKDADFDSTRAELEKFIPKYIVTKMIFDVGNLDSQQINQEAQNYFHKSL